MAMLKMQIKKKTKVAETRKTRATNKTQTKEQTQNQSIALGPWRAIRSAALLRGVLEQPFALIEEKLTTICFFFISMALVFSTHLF